MKRILLTALTVLFLTGCNEDPRCRPEANAQDFRTSVVELDGKKFRVIKEKHGSIWGVVAVIPEETK